jgi:hypothetical protein
LDDRPNFWSFTFAKLSSNLICYICQKAARLTQGLAWVFAAKKISSDAEIY